MLIKRTLSDCPGCGRLLPLQEFRKWWGDKRTLRTLCTQCEPERSLEALTPEERLAAVDQQRPFATPARVARMNAADEAGEAHRRSAGALARRRAERTRNWATVMRELRAERLWAARGAASPASPAWGVFFVAYEAALTDAVRRARAASSGTGRLMPTPDQLDPMHWLHEETLRTLRRLYSTCAPVRGRRLYRDPLCLNEVV